MKKKKASPIHSFFLDSKRAASDNYLSRKIPHVDPQKDEYLALCL